MIEVEKKFKPTDEQLNRLLEDAEFIGEKRYTDEYYDSALLENLRKGIRLRKRGNIYELKIKITKNGDKLGSEEIIDESEIIKLLNLDSNISLEQNIKERMEVLCSFETTRAEYKKDEFIIDVDKTDFGFNVVEIELQVESPDKITEANNKIRELASEFGLTDERIPGKLAECIRIKRQDLYEKFFKPKKVENNELRIINNIK